MARTELNSVTFEGITIDSFQDIDITTIPPNPGEALIWNGSNWVPGIVSGEGTETDPVFTASTVSNITNGTGFLVNDGAGNWSYDNTSYLSAIPAEYLTETEGDARYLQSFTETDPVFTASTVSNITNGTGFLVNDGAGNWSYDNTSYLSAIPAEYLTETEGDARYLQSFTETDPVFTASTVSNITNGTGFLVNDGAGNWSYDNSTYLTSYTETDTLQNVTTRGAVTTTNIEAASFTKTGATSDDVLLGDGTTTSLSGIGGGGGGQTLYVQTTEPTEWSVGDIWIRT